MKKWIGLALALAGCASQSKAPAGPAEDRTYVLLSTLDHGERSDADADAYRLELSLNADGTYTLVEFERGEKQQAAEGAYTTQPGRIILPEPPWTLLVDSETAPKMFCTTAAISNSGADTIEGDHTFMQVTRGGEALAPSDERAAKLSLKDGRYTIESPLGAAPSSGAYTIDGAYVSMTPDEGTPRTLAFIPGEREAVICQDAFEVQ